MSKFTSLFFLTLCLASSYQKGFGQYDTIRSRILFKDDLTGFGANDSDYSQIISAKAFAEDYWIYKNFMDCLLFGSIMKKSWHAKEKTLIYDKPLEFEGCTIYYKKTILRDHSFEDQVHARDTAIKFIFTKPVHLNSFSSRYCDMTISDVTTKEPFSFMAGNFPGFRLLNFTGSLIFSHNKVMDSMVLKGNRFQDFSSENNQYCNKHPQIRSADNYFAGKTKFDDDFFDMKMSFENDTIGGSMTIGDVYRTNKNSPGSGALLLSFDRCYINGPIKISSHSNLAKIVFVHCHFGPHASALGFMADTVEFVECERFPSTLGLQLKGNKDTCWLKIENTNFADINFVYAPLIHLVVDPGNVDGYTSNYENLLAKFQNEGKKLSYQLVDIEYQNVKAANGTRWNKVINWLNRAWWNYGYSKEKVIGWAILMLMVFFVINALLWKRMQELYPTSQSFDFFDRKTDPVRYEVQKYMRIFLYTAYIFFSIKIEPPNLKINNFWMLTYFFFQFLAGLWCLFFILNALLKIG